MPVVIAAAWIAAVIVLTVARLVAFRRRPAAFRWKWHPVFSALTTAITLIALLASGLPLSVAILFCSFGLCVGVQIALGSQFCGACGADVRNPMYRYQNWPKCPKCQVDAPPTPPQAGALFRLQFAALGFLILAGGFSLQLGPWVVSLVSLAGLSGFSWASFVFYRDVQIPMRDASVGAA